MRALILMLLWLAAVNASASEPEVALDAIVESARQLVPAKQIERSPPRYPKTELRKGTQAWVNVAYCIDESGTPKNISVVDSVGNSRFERAAIDAVERWKFEPALIDGKPSWQSRNQTIVTFAIEQANDGAQRKFIRAFKKLGKLIDEDKLEEADELFWRVYETYDLSLYELAKLWAQRVRYEGKVGDLHRLDLALHRATASKGQWIDKDSYVRLLTLRVRVELQIGKYREAARSFRALKDATSDDADEVVALKPLMDKVKEMVLGDDILRIPAVVKTRAECFFCNDSWHFSPVRNDFTLTNISGTLNSVEMRCDHKRFQSAITELVEWHIPKDWGRCNVHVYGEPGTTFDLLMLPAG